MHVFVTLPRPPGAIFGCKCEGAASDICVWFFHRELGPVIQCDPHWRCWEEWIHCSCKSILYTQGMH